MILAFIKGLFKNHSSLLTITFCVIVTTLSLLYGCSQRKQNKEIQEQLKLISSSPKEIKTTTKIIKQYIDTSGKKHTVIDGNANKVIDRALKEGSAIRIGLLDSAANVIQETKDKIDQVTKVNFVVSQENLILKKQLDSSKRVSYYYKDKYLTLTLRQSKLSKDTITSFTADYSMYANINWIDYSKRKIPFIGKLYNYTDIYSDNPNLFIKDNLQRVTIEHTNRNVGLRVQGNGIHFFNPNNLYLGGGVELGVGRLNVGGHYLYDFNMKKARPTISLNYNLIEF